MSLENEIQSYRNLDAGPFCESNKNSKISYTRDFLLSLSELDVCKKLPTGFDQSVLSEFEDAFHGMQDRQKIRDSPLLSFRCTEYGSSPPTKGDSSNYSRGVYGRWDNRSSRRSDRDSDSQSDWDSESGRQYGNQSRRSWQNSEHDGLLGSGSFPRSSGYGAGLSAPKVQSNDPYQLKKSNEPYHPPRPYKAVPHSRRSAHDSFNDETFGSTEQTSQDRAEEERRRRASFELMRKEQQKALQEKQKSNPHEHKNDGVSEITELLDDTKDGVGVFNKSNELDESVTQSFSNNDSSKSSLQTPAFRPRVPPGFRSTNLERNSGSRSSIHPHLAEVGRPEMEESLFQAKTIVQNGTLDNQEERQSAEKMGFKEQQHENTSIHKSFLNKGEQVVDSSNDLEVSNIKPSVNNQLLWTSSLSEATETMDGSEIIEFDTKVMGHKMVSDSKQDSTTSILEKLFGSALPVDLSVSSGFIEHHNNERDDSWSPNAVQSSKFSHWFLEDEKKAAEDPSYARPNDLLSLIVGSEKVGTQIYDMKATQYIAPDLPLQNSELTNSQKTSSSIGISPQFNNRSKEEAVPPILTCEDLEQTILSEYSENSSALQTPVQGWSVSGVKTEESKAVIDDRASQHLLSLLQKGTGLKDITQFPNVDSDSSNKLHVSEESIVGAELDNSRVKNDENICPSGKTLTLETLFGSAFMQELQSVEAPVSIQRGSVGSARSDISEQQGMSFGVKGTGLFPTSTDGIGSSRSGHESNVLQSSRGWQTKSNKIENWLGFNDTQVEVDPSKHQGRVATKLGAFDGAVDIQLPEEENLLTVGDPVNSPNSMFMSAGNSKNGEFLSSNKPVDIVEKLAALDTIFKDERPMVGQEGLPFVRGPYDPMQPEISYHNRHAQLSSPQFRPPQINHGRPFFHPLDPHPTHLNSQMNFLPPEGIIHDATANHQLPSNILRPPFHHPNTGPAVFDLPHHPMLHQMQTPGNFPPPYLLREFPRGGPLPAHSSNQATGYMQELNQLQDFPFRQQQPNFGGLEMPLPAPDVGGGPGGRNRPEAIQRLLEMELRANSKQIHPFAAAGHNQGMYGHELDMGFRYR